MSWKKFWNRPKSSTPSFVDVALRSARPMSALDLEAQRRSFAYGNSKIDNDSITRELVDEIAATTSFVRTR
jgi:hypothetical protein